MDFLQEIVNCGFVSHLFKKLSTQSTGAVEYTYCCILTLDLAVNQRCTCVNKREKKQKEVGVMKEYRQMLVAVESVGDRKASENELADWGLWPSATPSWEIPAKMRKKC